MSALSHDLVGNALGNLLILIRLHGVLATALGLGTQIGGVAEHLGTITATFMMGSVMMGSALRIASLKAIEPAMEKAISEESTS